jgi:hypothetical protein
MKRYVLLGDLVDSRRVPERAKFGAALNRILTQLNAGWGDVLHAPFSRLKGVDEIGAVMSSFKSGYRLVRTLEEALYPRRMRVAVSYGDVDVEPGGKAVAAMDGPAFHLASAELTGLKSSAYLFSLRSGHPSDALASALFNQLLLPTYRWTPRQRKIVRTYRELSRQQAVAKKLRISQQAVSQALRSVDWSAFKESETRLETFLAEALT